MGTPSKAKVQNGYATEDSDSDFVDVGLMQTWKKIKESTSEAQEKKVNGVQTKRPDALVVNVQRSQTARSSMKSPLSRIKDQESEKRRISFDLHEAKPQVSIQPSKDEPLRRIFANSRWSTSSSEPATPNKLLDEPNGRKVEDAKATPANSLETNDGFVMADETKKSKENPADKGKAKQQSIAVQKSKSLKPSVNRKRSIEVVVKRRHSAGYTSRTEAQGTALRDSAIDLISDEENSEAYTAVSLAGTLKRNAQPIETSAIKKKYFIIGVVAGTLAITIIVILAVLLARK